MPTVGIRVGREVHAELLRRQAEFAMVEGRRRSLSDVILGLLGQKDLEPQGSVDTPGRVIEAMETELAAETKVDTPAAAAKKAEQLRKRKSKDGPCAHGIDPGFYCRLCGGRV